MLSYSFVQDLHYWKAVCLFILQWLTHTVPFCGWCVAESRVKHLLAVLPFCCRAISFWVGGHILCESASAPTQKCQALSLSQPLSWLRSLPERRPQHHRDETEVMMRLRPVSLGMHEQTKQVTYLYSDACDTNSMNSRCSEASKQRISTNIQEVDKIELELLKYHHNYIFV